MLHSFYPAKHTTLILSKAENFPERALVGGLQSEREQALVFMEFLGDHFSFKGIIWGNSDEGHINTEFPSVDVDVGDEWHMKQNIGLQWVRKFVCVIQENKSSISQYDLS